MFAIPPIELSKVPPILRKRESLRFGTTAEFDAINFYEQLMESNILDPTAKKIIKSIIEDEKEHVAKFMFLLFSIDKEQAKFFGIDDVKCTFEKENNEEILLCKVRLVDGHEYTVKFEH